MKDNLYTIPAHLPFADTLAHWVLDSYGQDPLILSRVLILLPSRRGVKALQEAFLRATDGKPLLLPRMQPLGDVDEDLLLASSQWPVNETEEFTSPAFEMKRLFILARLISQYNNSRMDHALRLAQALSALLDELEREQLSLDGISTLVIDEFAKHWQVTVDFLRILSEHWPRIAAEEGLISPIMARNRALAALAKEWQHTPPKHPIIAAGTTGSVPATAALLKTILALSQGNIVLPGFDTQTDDAYYEHINESHPQFGMHHLLDVLECKRTEVKTIGLSSPADERRVQLLSEITRPAETSEAWQGLALDMPKGLQGIKRVVCASMQEEATAIALMLRQTLETSGKTAALVTHNRDLARRVSAIMQRFDVKIDDSAGMPLSQTPTASFLRLILEVAESNMGVVPLLSLLKHPFTHAGMARAECLEAARELEIRFLRGVAGNQWPTAERIKESSDSVQLLHKTIEQVLAPLLQMFSSTGAQNFSALLNAHLQCAEALAAEMLWNGPEADMFLNFLSDLQAVQTLLEIEPSTYIAVFETLLSGKVFRSQYSAHPRLKILSAIEARLQSFDAIILSDLNEGSWPPQIIADPWFNRAMRLQLGLPAPERKVGLAAHDFVQLASGKEVYFTRAEKIDGVPTTPARWLVKLDVLCKKYAYSALDDVQWKIWATELNAAEHVQPCKPPAPMPPLSARPKQLSVTQIETWMRDPYSIYAAHILRLHKLEPLGAEPSNSDFGNAVHKALEDFIKAFPEKLPVDALQQLLDVGHKALAPLFFSPAVEAFWWPRFVRIAEWIIAQEQVRRPLVKHVSKEVEGTISIGDFTLKGRADRIENLQDGGRVIADYKTGTLPTNTQIYEGLASQLILLGLIMGGDTAKLSLEYWHLKGGREYGEIKNIPANKIPELIEQARLGLQELIQKYNNPEFPYLSTPLPSRARRYNDYEHLARIKEWS